MDQNINISMEDYQELLAARFKINMIVNFMEDSKYGITDDTLRRILGIPSKEAEA